VLVDAVASILNLIGGLKMQSKKLIPMCIQAFVSEIARFKGSENTPENVESASHLIRVYTGKIQALDLSLSQADATAILRNAYISI
jgi:hypothetical protein